MKFNVAPASSKPKNSNQIFFFFVTNLECDKTKSRRKYWNSTCSECMFDASRLFHYLFLVVDNRIPCTLHIHNHVANIFCNVCAIATSIL